MTMTTAGDGKAGSELDPEIATALDASLAPYRDLLPAEALAEMRDFLEEVLETHPAAAALTERLRPRQARARSGEETRPGATVDERTPTKTGTKP